MIIDAAGKYLTRDGKTAEIFRVDQTTAVGRVPDDPEAHIWDVRTGDAIGHALTNSLVRKQHNLPALAQQIIKMLIALDGNPIQRVQVLNIVSQQICPDCGETIEPGLKCRCKMTKERGKTGRKAVH